VGNLLGKKRHAGRPRILLVTMGFTHPPTIGGRQRNNLLLRALQQIGDVDLVAIDGRPLDHQDELYMRAHHGLQAVVRMPIHVELPPWRWLAPLHPRLIERLAHNLGKRKRVYQPRQPVAQAVHRLQEERHYDLVVGRYLQYAMTAGLHLHPHSILDVDDVDTEKYRSRIDDPNEVFWHRWVLRSHLNQLQPILRENLPRFTALWVSNPSDRLLPGLERARVLVNLPYQAAISDPPGAWLSPANPNSKIALVVSSWGHAPNRHGLDVFLARVWPRVRQACPDAMLRVVGSQMTEEMRRKLAGIPGIHADGYVENLREVYADSAFSIAPVFSGGGTNIKVLEALWYGRPCLVTSVAHRGYQEVLPAGECLEVAHDIDALAEGAVRLYRDPDYRQRLAEAGRAAVERHFSFRDFCRVVEGTVEQVLRD